MASVSHLAKQGIPKPDRQNSGDKLPWQRFLAFKESYPIVDAVLWRLGRPTLLDWRLTQSGV
jgi:hypothetical protein